MFVDSELGQKASSSTGLFSPSRWMYWLNRLDAIAQVQLAESSEGSLEERESKVLKDYETMKGFNREWPIEWAE